MNLVVLMGNLTRDPELRRVKVRDKETSVTKFSLAINRFYKKADGQKEKDTTFINCEVWDTGAENIAKYVKKGDPILITGSLKNYSWEKYGQKHSTTRVRVDTFKYLSRRVKETEEVPVEVGISSEDIPF